MPLNRGEIGFLSCEDPETTYRIRALSKIRLSRGCAHSHTATQPRSCTAMDSDRANRGQSSSFLVYSRV